MEDRIICDRKPQLMTGLAPVKFTLTEEKTVAMCACKHSGKEPFCDGSHAKLPE